MKKVFSSVTLMLLVHHTGFANPTGAFFNATTQGPTLTVNTLVPNHPNPYPFASLQILSPGYTFADTSADCIASDFNQKKCFVSLSNTVPKSFTISGPAGTVDIKACLNGEGTLTCQHIKHRPGVKFPSLLGYVVSSGQEAGFRAFTQNAMPSPPPANEGFVTICPIKPPLGLFASSSCITSASKVLKSPQAITFNPAGTMAYLSNHGDGSVVNCAVNQQTGALSSCVYNAGGLIYPFPFGHNVYGAVGVSDQFVYVPDNEAQIVYSCPINSNGMLGQCVNSGVLFGGGHGPNSVTLNAAGTLAYITAPGIQPGAYPNFGPFPGTKVIICPVAGAMLGPVCALSQDFNGPLSVSFNAEGTVVYVANGNTSTVSVCSDPLTLAVCTPSSQSFNFNSVNLGPAVSLFMSTSLPTANGNIDVGYIPNSFSDTVSICSLASGTGALISCTQVGGNNTSPYYFITPTGVATLNLP